MPDGLPSLGDLSMSVNKPNLGFSEESSLKWLEINEFKYRGSAFLARSDTQLWAACVCPAVSFEEPSRPAIPQTKQKGEAEKTV